MYPRPSGRSLWAAWLSLSSEALPDRRRRGPTALSFSLTYSGACARTLPAESNPARPALPGHLVEFPGREHPAHRTVVLGQPGEKDRPDGHVDPDAERVGTADDLQEPFLAETLNEPAVFRQHARVVNADPVSQQAGKHVAKSAGEAEPGYGAADSVALGPRRQLGAGKRLGPLDRGPLRKVHGVNRAEALGHELGLWCRAPGCAA